MNFNLSLLSGQYPIEYNIFQYPIEYNIFQYPIEYNIFHTSCLVLLLEHDSGSFRQSLIQDNSR